MTLRARDGRITLVVGFPGAGKTTLALHRIRAARALRRKCVVYDPTGDIRKAVPELRPIETAAQLRAEFGITFGTSPGFACLGNGAERVIPSVAGEPWFRDSIVIVDEAEFVFPSSGLFVDARAYLHLNRNRGLETWVVSKRPQDMHPLVRQSAGHVCAFRLNSLSAIEALGDCHAEERFRECLELSQFEYLYRPPWTDAYDSPLELRDSSEAPTWAD